MLKRLPEFFEGEGNRLSMSRLLCFISIFPASYILLKTPEVSSELLGVYLGAYALSYVGGKAVGNMPRRRKGRLDESE